jgi:hypothetical protein
LAEGSSLFGLRPIVRPCRKAAFVWPVDTLCFLLVVSVVCAFFHVAQFVLWVGFTVRGAALVVTVFYVILPAFFKKGKRFALIH